MVRLRLIAAALLAAAGMGGASAAQLAQLQPGERPLAGSTEAELWYGMEQAEKQIRQSPSVVHDPALQAYVEGLVCKVAGAHCGDRDVHVLAAPHVGVAHRRRGAAHGEAPVVAGAVPVPTVQDVEERRVAGPDDAVGEHVGVRRAALAGDGVDALDVLGAEVVQPLGDKRNRFVFAHAGLHRLVEIVVGGVDHHRRHVQKRDLVVCLDLARNGHQLLAVYDIDAFALKR